MDVQAPPLDAVAPKPLTVADELQPSPSQTDEVEDALPSAMDGQFPHLDAVALEPLTVSDDPQPSPLPPLEVEDVLPDTVNAASSGSPEAGAGGVVLSDELRDQIVKQVEYYFSDENLPTDKFLLKYVKKNKEGFVPFGVIASFRRMKKLVQDISLIEAALRTSSKLVVNSDGKMIRRLHPMPQSELKDSKKSTVVVDNLPSGFSMESIQEIFGTIGKIVNITINDPPSMKESATANFISSSKVHALVEYEAVEAAEKAVSTLSDETNWRTGMKGEPQQQKPNAKGAQKGRYRGQGKGQGQNQQDTNRQGSSDSEPFNKPIPGPRMPDGTRGFTMGRGRSLPLHKSEKAEE